LPGFDPASHRHGLALAAGVDRGLSGLVQHFCRRKLRELALLADFQRSVMDDDIA
jgi:hypothetical protein